jgi:Osmosensitive K+ channel His kinase sensor domain
MIPTTAFQPKWVSMYAKSQFQRLALAKHHWITLKEIGLDAVLQGSRPFQLVDELAHTNAPQSRNRKRCEDVQDLLRAGINVIATVNIQHLESLDNIVEDMTGLKVKERIRLTNRTSRTNWLGQGKGSPLWFINVSFCKRFVWEGRRPAGHDQKHIEDEERNGNVIEESRLG